MNIVTNQFMHDEHYENDLLLELLNISREMNESESFLFRCQIFARKQTSAKESSSRSCINLCSL